MDFWNYLEDQSRRKNSLIIARDLARTPAITVSKNDNLLTALQKITDFHVELLPVVNNEIEKNLEGVLSRNDIINAYNRKLRQKMN